MNKIQNFKKIVWVIGYWNLLNAHLKTPPCGRGSLLGIWNLEFHDMIGPSKEP